MTRITTSVSLTPEHQKFIKDEGLSPTSLLQQAIEARMNGHYDEDREGVLDEMVDRFFKSGRGRTFMESKDWLESPVWKEDLRSVGMTPMGFMSICRKRVEAGIENGIDPLLQYMVGIIDKIPPSAIKMPKVSGARRRHIEHQEALARQWELEQNTKEEEQIDEQTAE